MDIKDISKGSIQGQFQRGNWQSFVASAHKTDKISLNTNVGVVKHKDICLK